ncbi:hypothetical protein NC651_034619 [Populus alba x Populus x berolinensis]|nr:hypothetical protein NC651_034619 [Populus alba x Populus x berolinensis]
MKGIKKRDSEFDGISIPSFLKGREKRNMTNEDSVRKPVVLTRIFNPMLRCHGKQQQQQQLLLRNPSKISINGIWDGLTESSNRDMDLVVGPSLPAFSSSFSLYIPVPNLSFLTLYSLKLPRVHLGLLLITLGC